MINEELKQKELEELLKQSVVDASAVLANGGSLKDIASIACQALNDAKELDEKYKEN